MPWEPPVQPVVPKKGFFDRIATRAEVFFDTVQVAILKMATLPERMEKNIKILIGVIVGSLLLIHFMNRKKG